jgi:hypothetical protein
MCLARDDYRPLRRDRQSYAIQCAAQKRLRAYNVRELFGSLVAAQIADKWPKPDSFTAGKYDRP